MDVDQIKNISSNETFDPEEDYYNERHVLAVPLLLAVTIGIISNLLIVIVILKNRTLHTRTNIYITNFCVCNIFYLVFTPLILNLFSELEKIQAYIICFSDEIFFLFMFGNYLFACILLLDWYIVSYKSLNSSARCRSSYKLIIMSVWTIIFVFILTVFLQCTSGISVYTIIAFLAISTYFSSFILVAIICLMKIINEKTTSIVETKKSLELLYVMSFFIFWFPNWLFLFFSIFYRILSNQANLGLFTFIIGYLHSLILLILMYKKDSKFRYRFRQIFFNVKIDIPEDDRNKDDDNFTTLI